MSRETVTVTVQYVGKDDFVDTVPAQKELQAVKVEAMKSFELDPSQARKYVLQFNSADVADHKKLADFGADAVVLALRLMEEVAKG